MSRESLCDDWRVSLAHCESAADDAPPRYQRLYRVQARIYRILLGMYGGEDRSAEETWKFPDPEIEEPAGVFVAAGLKDEAPTPLKTKAEILSTLKRISDSNDPVPMGYWTEEAIRLQPFLIADVVKAKDLQVIRRALYHAGIRHVHRWQGSHHQVLVDPADRVAATAIVSQARRERQHREFQQIRAARRRSLELLLSISGILCLAAGIVVVSSALLDLNPEYRAPQLSWGCILLVAGPTLLVCRWCLNQQVMLPPPTEGATEEETEVDHEAS